MYLCHTRKNHYLHFCQANLHIYFGKHSYAVYGFTITLQLSTNRLIKHRIKKTRSHLRSICRVISEVTESKFRSGNVDPNVEVVNWKLNKQISRNWHSSYQVERNNTCLTVAGDAIIMSDVIVDPRHLFMYAVPFTLLGLGIYCFGSIPLLPNP